MRSLKLAICPPITNGKPQREYPAFFSCVMRIISAVRSFLRAAEAASTPEAFAPTMIMRLANLRRPVYLDCA